MVGAIDKFNAHLKKIKADYALDDDSDRLIENYLLYMAKKKNGRPKSDYSSKCNLRVTPFCRFFFHNKCQGHQPRQVRLVLQNFGFHIDSPDCATSEPLRKELRKARTGKH